MFIFPVTLLVQVESTFRKPSYFGPVIATMFLLGAVAWLIAAVLGFARARAFGPSTRWFAFAAVCMIIYHIQFLLIALGIILENPAMTLTVGAFFNLFAVVAALCSIMGFVRLTSPR